MQVTRAMKRWRARSRSWTTLILTTITVVIAWKRGDESPPTRCCMPRR